MVVKKKKSKPKTYLAMDIGSHSIKFAVGIYQGGKVRVNQLFLTPLPLGTYENGLIRDNIIMRDLIIASLKQHKVKEKEVVLTIESTDIIKREMTIPKVEAQDMIDLITYEVGQYLPIDVNNYVLQYKVMGEEKQGDKDVCQILLGAMPVEMAKSHFDLLKAVGLTPLVMDIHSNALGKLVHLIKYGSGGVPHQTQGKENPFAQDKALKTTAFIDFGYERIDINIMEGDVNRFNRILRLGVSGVDQIIAANMEIELRDVESKRLGFSEDSMLSLKKAYDAIKTLHEVHHFNDAADGIALDEANLSAEDQKRTHAVHDTFDYLYMCLDEVDKVFKYYMSRSMDYRIDQIALYGGATLNKDFHRFVQDRLDIPCYLFDVSAYSALQLKNVQESPTKFVNVIGALIRH